MTNYGDPGKLASYRMTTLLKMELQSGHAAVVMEKPWKFGHLSKFRPTIHQNLKICLAAKLQPDQFRSKQCFQDPLAGLFYSAIAWRVVTLQTDKQCGVESYTAVQ